MNNLQLLQNKTAKLVLDKPLYSSATDALNPFSAKDVLIDFTLSNARRFYSSQGAPLAVKRLKNYLSLKKLSLP